MAVLPNVRLVFPCDDARYDLADEKWTLHHPWGSTVVLPPGAQFPFRLVDGWVYTQLTDGVGSVALYVELRQLMDDGTERSVGYSEVNRLELLGESRWLTIDTAFLMKRLPFRSAGRYEFRVVAEGDEGFRVLAGHATVIRVLDGDER